MPKFFIALVCLHCCCFLDLVAAVPTGTKCSAEVGSPTCVCETPDGVVDLTGLASTDGSPRYNYFTF